MYSAKQTIVDIISRELILEITILTRCGIFSKPVRYILTGHCNCYKPNLLIITE